MFKKLLVVCLILAAFATPVQAFEASRDLYVMWDGKLTDKDFSAEQFAALTKTTVYASEQSPTGYYVTFRFYGPNETRVRIAGEWYYSEALYSSQYSAAKIHPNDWYNGAIIHTDDTFPLRPFNDMVLNKDTGYWAYTIPLASGTYCYQFLVGGNPGDRVDDTSTGKLMSDPQNMPAERAPNIEAYSQVLVPYHPEKQSKSPDYSFYQHPRADKRGSLRFETVPSRSLGFNNGIGIYLPYDYDPNRAVPYPILYISHGSAGFESNWMSQGMIPNITDNLIAEGLVEPMIVVSPNMRHANGEWFNLGNVDRMGKPLPPAEPKAGVTGTFESYIMDELIPYMEEHYNVTKDPAKRAFSGLSQGGRMTFAMLTSNPTEFGYFYMMSGANDLHVSQNYDLTRPELKEPTVAFGCGIFDRALFSTLHPTQRALSENGIQFTMKYAVGAHRWHIWRELYVDLCTRVLWK